MKKILNGLLETMETQAAIYERLLALSRDKQPVLVEGNIQELEKITKEEEILILQVGRLEEQRKVLHQELASHFSLSPEELTVSEIIKRADDKELADRIQTLQGNFTDRLNSLGKMNKSNSELIKSSLNFINYSLNLLTNNDATPVYGEQDEEKRVVSAKIFDRKI